MRKGKGVPKSWAKRARRYGGFGTIQPRGHEPKCSACGSQLDLIPGNIHQWRCRKCSSLNTYRDSSEELAIKWWEQRTQRKPECSACGSQIHLSPASIYRLPHLG